MDFFGIGISELFVIAMIALIFIKPSELPGVIRGIVKQIQTFRTMSFNVKREIMDIYEKEIEPEVQQIKDNIKDEVEPYKAKLEEEYNVANEQMDEVRKNITTSDPFEEKE